MKVVTDPDKASRLRYLMPCSSSISCGLMDSCFCAQYGASCMQNAMRLSRTGSWFTNGRQRKIPIYSIRREESPESLFRFIYTRRHCDGNERRRNRNANRHQTSLFCVVFTTPVYQSQQRGTHRLSDQRTDHDPPLRKECTGSRKHYTRGRCTRTRKWWSQSTQTHHIGRRHRQLCLCFRWQRRW